MDDWDLICAYRHGEESAFSELVRRHVNLVYSAAYRSLGGNAWMAEDAVQMTFALFARKIRSLKASTSVVGWLYKSACNISREIQRREARRRKRESEVMHMPQETVDSEGFGWEELASVLEGAMYSLSESDRGLILLRFFERKAFREIGDKLGLSEDAAKMRASRALQKLRHQLLRRGVTVSAGALGTMLWENSVNAAPVSLAGSLTVAKLAGATVPFSIAAKLIVMTNLTKTAAVAGVILLIATVGTQVGLRQRSNGDFRSAVTGGVAAATHNPIRIATAEGIGFDPRLNRTIENLRKAIIEPWPNRRLPAAHLRQCVEDFGADRKAAVPVLLEFLKAPRAQRSLLALGSAAFCLELLGTDASAALPDLIELAREGDLSILNDGMPKLFASLSPDGRILPALIQILATSPPAGGQQVQITINRLIDLNPDLADTYRPRLAQILTSEDSRTRLHAATALARLPGAKEPAALPILIDALAMDRLRDPKAYEPIQIGDGSTVSREGLRFEDDMARLEGVQALGEMGSAAENAVGVLAEFAGLSPTNNPYSLRDFALSAIGKIDPKARQESAELDAALRTQERVAELKRKAQSRTASLEELEEGLKTKDAADWAAEALAGHPEERRAIPSLLQAIDQFGSSEAVDRIKDLEPDLLVQLIRSKNTNALTEVARALGELGPAMFKAVVPLRQMLDETTSNNPDLGRPYALDEAIHRIDPGQPKLLYHFDDLHEATSALTQAIYAQGKIRSPVYDAYIRDFQDINAVSRGHLFRFIEATRADPELHALFVKKLREKNPELDRELSSIPTRLGD